MCKQGGIFIASATTTVTRTSHQKDPPTPTPHLIQNSLFVR